MVEHKPLLATIFVLIAMVRIAATYPVFNNSFDEAHFSAGVEWLDGSYWMERQHPPLARIVLAIGPYLGGARPMGQPTIWDEANAQLAPHYWRNLTLARLGVLPFFALACWVLWMWARDLFGPAVALASVGLFTLLPPVLAHSGLATLDMACAATVFAAGYAWYRGMGIILGLAVAAAVLTKFSALLFLPVICVVARRRLRLIAIPVAIVAILAVYRSDVRAFTDGISEVWDHNAVGHASWLLGRYGYDGWWYFFPVVLAVKTPLAFLSLCAVGVTRAAWLPVACATGILAVCLPARINLGVRHILIIYPFLAMVAGAGLMRLWRHSRAVAGMLALSVVASSAMAHPDYLAYFNAAAPEMVLAESDLDWGQDLQRASDALRALGVKQVWLSYFGSADVSRFGLPAYQQLPMGVLVKGWIAVSIHDLTIGSAMSGGGLDWLKAYKPVVMAGKSIRIYHVE